MTFRLDEAVPILARTPVVLRTLLAGLPQPWLEAHEGADSWNPYQVVGHLIDGERHDWIVRARIIITRESRRFEPFDRFAHLTWTRGQSLDELLDSFGKLRAANLGTLGEWRLGEEMLDRTGVHPDFGVVTLRQLLATWVAHDLGHLGQIARVMAKRYTGEVGPWKAYLPVLATRG